MGDAAVRYRNRRTTGDRCRRLDHREGDMDPIEFRIVSLSYDVHNKKVFGTIDRTAGTLGTSINFDFPYTSGAHQNDDDLKLDIEREVRKVLAAAAQFR